MKRVLKIFGLLFLMSLFLTGCGNDYVLEGVPVEFRGYNKEAYVVEGSEKTMDVNISAEQSVIDKIKSSKNNKVVLDMEDNVIPEKGKYFKYTFETDVKDKFDYEIFPEGVTVKLEEKVSDSVVVEPKVINLDKLDKKLGIKSIKLDKGEVIIRGSIDAVDRVDIVEAEIDISILNLNDTGTFNYYDAVIKCYDKDYKEVVDVEIVHQKTDAQIVIHEGEHLYNVSSTKTVPVNIKLTGELSNGTAVSNITIDGVAYDSYFVEIEGRGIDDVNFVEVSVDVTGLDFHDGNKVFNVSIAKPSAGVKDLRRKGKSVSSVILKVEFAEAKQKTITNLPIRAVNVPYGKVVNIKQIYDREINVQLIGTEANLKDVSSEDIIVYVDFSNKGVGEQKVDVYAESDNPMIQLIPSKKYVEVVVSKSN